MTTRSRITWTTKPKCWDDEQAWRDWMQDRQGAHGPCADCTPEHRKRMRDELRCERPETIFMRSRDGELSGISADDPAFARLLMGLSVRGEIVGRAIEVTEPWIALLRFVRKRAGKEVKRAIDIWLRRAAT